jgi:hypothetical protein
MNSRAIILAVVVFGLIVIGMFTFAYLERSSQYQNRESENDAASAPATTTDSIGELRIDAKHFVAAGTHTFAGTLEMPTPCHLLQVEASVLESFPEQIVLDFTVLNNAEMCPQVITPQRFKVSASASEQAVVSARFMGQPVDLNLIPAAAGETPDDFELFIKG